MALNRIDKSMIDLEFTNLQWDFKFYNENNQLLPKKIYWLSLVNMNN